MPRKPLELLTESMFYVLMALKSKPLHGTEIATFIEGKTAKRVRIGPGTLYTILAKFEKINYIKEVSVVGRKRTYEITEKGKNAYNAELERLTLCVNDAKTTEVQHEQ